MNSQLSKDFNEEINEYKLANEQVISILNDAKDAIKGEIYNDDIENELYSRIENVGPLASKVICNVIAYKNYQEFFHSSFPLLKRYIEEGLREKWGGNKDGIVELLFKVGAQGYDLLCYVLIEDADENRKFKAAKGLLRIGELGVSYLKSSLINNDENIQKIVIKAIASSVRGYFSDDDYERTKESFSQDDIDGFILILQDNLSHGNDEVKAICISILLEIRKLDMATIEAAIEDKNPTIRYNTLIGLLQNGIGKKEAKAFAISLEDPHKEISELSLRRLDKSFIKNPDAVLASILEELIIRTSGRPKEFFNTKLTVDAIRKVADLNPRLMGQTLHKLRDSAFEYYEQPVMPRVVFVAQKLSQKEFVSLVGEKAKEFPGVAQKILNVVNSGLSITDMPNFGVADFYVDPNRIVELKSISSAQFDLVKLIRFCEELNSCYQSGSFLSVIMLVRAILDHTPPIFNCRTFSEVANNYGGKSLKKSFLNLQNSSRNIADAHLHEAIRLKEALPNKTQVDFRNDLDVLLSEIVRVLK